MQFLICSFGSGITPNDQSTTDEEKKEEEKHEEEVKDITGFTLVFKLDYDAIWMKKGTRANNHVVWPVHRPQNWSTHESDVRKSAGQHALVLVSL